MICERIYYVRINHHSLYDFILLDFGILNPPQSAKEDFNKSFIIITVILVAPIKSVAEQVCGWR